MAKLNRKKVKVKIFLFSLFLLPLYLLFFTFFQSSATELGNNELPPLNAHPLPPTLVQWQDATNSGDYFSQVKPTKVGYLVWSDFPVKVYVERPLEPIGISAAQLRFQQWVEAVLQAVQEWSVYLPLLVVEEREKADIVILHQSPPLKVSFNHDTGELQLPRARTAETSYQIYLRQQTNTAPELYHRCNILLSPDLSARNIQAAARHEVGHGLGIWGHSPLEADTMYFSQVRNPPPISHRDVNTLKRVYEQSTRLGWLVPELSH